MNPLRVAETQRKTKYGVTAWEFENFKRVQNGACAICKEAFTGAPHVDHDHVTGFVRGLLCVQCNTSLGGFRDSETLLQDAIGYIRRSELTQAARKIFQVEKQTVNKNNKTKA